MPNNNGNSGGGMSPTDFIALTTFIVTGLILLQQYFGA